MATTIREALPLADPIGMYLEEVSEHTLLTAEDEVDLARAMELGHKAQRKLDLKYNITPADRAELFGIVHEGEEAKMTFIRSNLRLVISIAKRYAGRGLDLLDLIQEGNLGLIRAVEKFDWRKGFKFSTYATWWIRQAITRGLGNQARTIRLPVHMVDIVRTVKETAQLIVEENHRPATPEEIAEASGLDVERVRAAFEAPPDTVSLDRPIGENGEAALKDFVEDDLTPDPFAQAAVALRRAHIERALETLNGEESRVVRLRYGLDGDEPLTLSDVGKSLDLTRERIRQIEGRALAKLRHPSCVFELEDLL